MKKSLIIQRAIAHGAMGISRNHHTQVILAKQLNMY